MSRTRRFVSSIRTGGRIHRACRRFYAREVAAGRKPPQQSDRHNAYEVAALLRKMYTHVRFTPPGGNATAYMNRIVSPSERERAARAKVSREVAAIHAERSS